MITRDAWLFATTGHITLKRRLDLPSVTPQDDERFGHVISVYSDCSKTCSKMSNIIIIRAYNLKVTATNDQSNPVLIGDVVSMSFGD